MMTSRDKKISSQNNRHIPEADIAAMKNNTRTTASRSSVMQRSSLGEKTVKRMLLRRIQTSGTKLWINRC